MRKLLFITVSLVIVNGLIFTPTTTLAAAKKEILLGALNFMTGIETMVGSEHRWAYQQAVKDINAKGGVYVKDLGKKLPLRLVVVDDESDVAKAAGAAEKLIKLQKVDFVLGSVSTRININGASVAEKYERLYVSTTFFPEMFAEQKFKWVAASFFSIAKLAGSAAACLDPVPAAGRPKNFCVFVPDDPDGHGFGRGAKATLAKYNYKLALYEPFTPGGKDLSASILRMKAAGCDGLITFLSSMDGITLVRQLKENKVNFKYIWGAKGFWPIEFGEALGKDADYIISDGHWAEALGAPGSKELGEKYRAEFGSTKYSVTIGNFYSLVQHLVQAIQKAGSIDNAKVRDVYYSGTFVAKDTTEGDLAFNKIGIAEFPAVALQWMGGKRMPVYPPSPKVWTIKLIPPWDKRERMI
jgi:branched-chain amino acid transport system substrate-binding protein